MSAVRLAQHFVFSSYEAQLQDKVERLRSLLERFGNTPEPEICPSPRPTHYRDRANFGVWVDYNGDDLADIFYYMHDKGDDSIGDQPLGSQCTSPQPNKASSSTRVRIEQHLLANERINALMGPLLERVRAEPLLWKRLFEVRFLTGYNTGEVVVTLLYHRKLTEEWLPAARLVEEELGVHLVGRSAKKAFVPTQDYITDFMRVDGKSYRYRQYEGTFTQPNGAVCELMLQFAVDCARTVVKDHKEHDFLELYCGNGNFTLPLAAYYQRVFATEIVRQAVKAAELNMADNGVANVNVLRMSSEDFVDAYSKAREFERLRLRKIDLQQYRFKTVLVDPPRSGLDRKTLDLVSNFDSIIYISCNPVTLAENLDYLSSSFRIAKVALFDQFPFTDHVEAGVLLVKENT